jgi:hypothetical protein
MGEQIPKLLAEISMEREKTIAAEQRADQLQERLDGMIAASYADAGVVTTTTTTLEDQEEELNHG